MSRGSGFKASNEVAAAIVGGIAAKPMHALVAALNSFESVSSEDVNTIFKLYEVTPSVAMTAKAVKVPKALVSVAKQRGSCPPLPVRLVAMKLPDLLLSVSNLCQCRKISSLLQRMTHH